MLLFLTLCIVAVVAAKVVFPHHKEEASHTDESSTKDEQTKDKEA